MPMPHRTFAQVAKRRLTGKEGRERIREVNALLAELPGLQERAIRGPAQVAARGDRGHPRPLERRPPRFDRRPARGRGADRARRAAQRRQVVAAAGAVRDPDQDRRLPVHHAPAGPGADPDRRRARPAGRDPGPDRRRHGRSGRRPGAARRPAHGRRDRLLLPRGRRSGRARDRPRRDRRWPASTSRPSSPRRAPTRPPLDAIVGLRRRIPDAAGDRGLGARRGVARGVPRRGLGADRPDPRPAAEGRQRRPRARSRSSPARP